MYSTILTYYLLTYYLAHTGCFILVYSLWWCSLPLSLNGCYLHFKAFLALIKTVLVFIFLAHCNLSDNTEVTKIKVTALSPLIQYNPWCNQHQQFCVYLPLQTSKNLYAHIWACFLAKWGHIIHAIIKLSHLIIYGRQSFKCVDNWRDL